MVCHLADDARVDRVLHDDPRVLQVVEHEPDDEIRGPAELELLEDDRFVAGSDLIGEHSEDLPSNSGVSCDDACHQDDDADDGGEDPNRRIGEGWVHVSTP